MIDPYDLHIFFDRCEIRGLNDIQVIREARTEWATLEKAAVQPKGQVAPPSLEKDQYLSDLKALVFFLEHGTRPLDVTPTRFAEIEAFGLRLMQARRLGLAARYFVQKRMRR